MSAKNKSKRLIEIGEDDPHFMPSPCFQLSPSVELKDIPTNGEEYLLKVMEERSKYSSVSISKINLKKYAKNQSSFCEDSTEPAAPDNVKPTIEWQNIQVADFSDVRMYIERMLARKACDSKENSTKKNVEDWKLVFETEPTLSFVVQLSQAVVDEGLEVLTEMLEKIEPGKTVDHKIGQWIYTLLAVTKYPHLSDTTSTLRALARQCLEVRSRINPESEDARTAITPLNIFICLIGRYFRQFDLAD